ncbi:MAG: hypothetical protein KAS32_04580 [Candidatus Peribacteraceae bacterium]|nr:hypothetical protein [Candidatus Peribacteraceae bacterium]
MIELKTCGTCWFYLNAEDGDVTCCEAGKCSESLACQAHCTPEIELSETGKMALLQDIEGMLT